MIEYYNMYYIKEWKEYDTVYWYMLNPDVSSYYRRIRTYREKQRNCKDRFEKNLYGYRVRRTKKKLPDAWDDKQVSKASSKGWKDLAKVKKQWEKRRVLKSYSNIRI